MTKKEKGPERYKCPDHVSWRRVADEVVVLDLKTSDYFSLNETAAVAWEKLVAGATVEEAAEAVCRRFKAEPDEAIKHVKALVQKLIKSKALVERTGPAPRVADKDFEIGKGAKAPAKRSYVLPAIVAMGLLDAAAPHPAAASPSPF